MVDVVGVDVMPSHQRLVRIVGSGPVFPPSLCIVPPFVLTL